MNREPAEPLRLDYLIRAGAVHSMTGETYRSVGVRGPEIVAVSAEPEHAILWNMGGEMLHAWGALTGRPLHGRGVSVVIGFAFLVTITVVMALFIARPGGNAATAVAFGGYVGLAAIGTIKGGAIVTAVNARKRMISGPALA